MLNNDAQEGSNFCVTWNWQLVPHLICSVSSKLRLDMWYTYINTNSKTFNFLPNLIFAVGKIWHIPANAEHQWNRMSIWNE
jgi:hypothetical protein